MTTSPIPATEPIKVGVIADLTGPLSFVGLANANVARMVIGDFVGVLDLQLAVFQPRRELIDGFFIQRHSPLLFT